MIGFIEWYLTMMAMGFFFHLGFVAGSNKDSSTSDWIVWTLFGWLILILSIFVSLMEDFIKYIKASK